MKFTHEFLCSCGRTFQVSTYGDDPWPDAVCTQCGSMVSLINSLSVSVTAERLLNRSKVELDGGDYSLSILIGTIAVESFLARLFLKLKGMESYATTLTLPTPAQEEAWKDDFRKSGFIKPADFVSKARTGMTFDDFAGSNPAAIKIMAVLPGAPHFSAKKYFQMELFNRRNEIAHWGYVNSKQEEAQLCHTLAVAILAILQEMDRSTVNVF